MKVPFIDTVLLNAGAPKGCNTIVFRYPLGHSKDFTRRELAKESDKIRGLRGTGVSHRQETDPIFVVVSVTFR
jgi:hypothetical protein